MKPTLIFAFLVILLVTKTDAQVYSSSFLAYNNLNMDGADIDQDGDMDIISGGLRVLSWEENKGNGLFINHVISQNLPEVQAVVGVDLDEDGYTDVISASLSNNVIYWSRNNGTQTFSTTSIATATGGCAGLATGDFDNDGDIDIVGAAFNGDRIFWLRNNGSEVFTQIDIITGFDSAIKVRAGDMDNDGDIDILAAAREGGQILWLRNNGSGTFTSVILTSALSMPRDIKLRDYDQDGDLDVLYTSDSGNGWFRNINGAFTQFPYSSGSGVYSIDVADINQDGFMDWITANSPNGSVYYALNNGNQVLSPGGPVDTQINSPNLLVCNDFNGDGRVDVMCGSNFDIRLGVNGLGAVFTNIALMKYASNNHGACHGDFDNDGDVDLMEVGFTFMYWYRNEGNGEYTPIRLTDNGFSYINTNYGVYIRAADMDGDGDLDAVYSENDNNKVSWIENRGGGLFSYHLAFGVSGPYCVDPIDFDNDGDMDVVTTSTANDAVYWFENNGNEVFTQRLINAEYWDPFSVRTVDIDNDGDYDVVVAQGTPSNKIMLFRNSGNNASFSSSTIDASASGANAVYVIDLDQDGDIDILSASSTEGKIAWYESTGGSFPTFTERTVSTGVDGATYVFADDYDGDGDFDVISTAFTDLSVDLFVNNGSESFTRVELANVIDGADFVESGDLDGDGLADIYATGSTHGIVQVFKKQEFTLPPPVTLTPCTDIFISEYVEGSSYNKGLEIYNPTSDPIALAPYRLLIYANGSTTPTQTIFPQGTIQPNDVWAIAHSLGDLEFYFAADIDATLNFNGNDAIALTKNGDIIDLIGVIGQDPGIAWTGSNGASTLDKTLVRKPEITHGNNIQSSTFDASIEWIVYPNNAYQYFGNHECVCSGACVPTISIAASATTICQNSTVTFTATVGNEGPNPIYQWKVNSINVGTNSPVFTSSTLTNNSVVTCTLTSNESCALPGDVISNSINIMVTNPVSPSVSISSSATTVCPGELITFTAIATNGGITPSYQWKKNNVNTGTNSSSFSSSGLVNGDVITCVLTSSASCLSSQTATSNAITITVSAAVNPSISITASTTSICAGTSVTFTATPTNGGTNPSYQWKKNGVNVGTNSSTYSLSNLISSDVITCVLTSNATCISTSTATSNSISITVTPLVNPGISISASQNTICVGSSITFTATPTNGGSSPIFQWKKNGVSVGSNVATYSSSTWANGDVITCSLTGSLPCGNTTANSNSITVTVSSPVSPSVSIITNNTSSCSGSLVTFTANPTNAGMTPVYSWLLNGSPVGTNSSSYSASNFQNGDVISLTLTSSLSCVTISTATSNAITLTVNPPVTPAIAITADQISLCAGSTASFQASISNGGTSPSYQWRRNGQIIGSNSSVFSSNLLSNNDVINCQLTSNVACASPSVVTSNSITVSFTTTVTPTVVVTADNLEACQGDTIEFTAATSDAGLNPTFAWFVNGIDQGINNISFTPSNLNNGDQVSCAVAGTENCIGQGFSSTVFVSISSVETPVITEVNSLLFATEIPGAVYSWYLNDELLEGTQISILQPTSGGTYTVTATVNVCESSLSAPFELFVLGQSSHDKSIYSIAPNPCSSWFKIVSEEKILQVFIYDAHGLLVLQSQLSENYIDHLAQGMYIIRIHFADRVVSTKLIITK
jgi:hypothetical protein